MVVHLLLLKFKKRFLSNGLSKCDYSKAEKTTVESSVHCFCARGRQKQKSVL